MSKDISKKNQDNISKAKEEFENFIKVRNIKKPETQSISSQPTQQGVVKATVPLHCQNIPGKISTMEFEVTDERALLIRTVPVKNELTTNDAKQSNSPFSFTKKIVYANGSSDCPHCQNPLKFFCECGAISCHPENNDRHTCPVCKNSTLTTPFTKPRPIAGSRAANRAEGKCGYGNIKSLPKEDNSLLKLK